MSQAALQRQDHQAIESLVATQLKRPVASIETIAQGLSTRRFYRVHFARDEPLTAIARLEAREDPRSRPGRALPEPPLEPLRAHLERAGLPVPRRLAASEALELLEDLGNCSLEDAAGGADATTLRELYTEACALPPRLQRVTPRGGVEAFSRRLDTSLFEYKATRFVEWGLPLALGRAAHAAESQVVREAFSAIAEVAEAAPQGLAHRDFKAANLMVSPPDLMISPTEKGAHPQRLTMIDLQGAFLAPPEYDLVCLLRDSHVELPEALVGALADQARQQLPTTPDETTFATRFDLLTVSRVGKDLALYRYAAKTRDDARYQRFIPTAARNLVAALGRISSHAPALRRLDDLLAPLREVAASPPVSADTQESRCAQ